MKMNRTGLLVFLSMAASGSGFAPATSIRNTNKRSCDSNTPSITYQNRVDRVAFLSKDIFSSRREPGKSVRFMTENDDIDEPLAKGVDSVSWLPTVIGAQPSDPDNEDTDILPLFPLGGIVYTPNSEHTLNIFEPRYRQMYNDILMNGSKRFVVAMSHPTEKGRFAQIGVLFELEDLKEVSEQTNDQVKYICNHRVTGRVKLHKILNPSAWTSRETYLKVEGTLIDANTRGTDQKAELKSDQDDDVYSRLVQKTSAVYDAPAPKEEANLKESFKNLVELQHELEEDVRFTLASIDTLAVSPGDKDEGLWTTIRLWQSYSEQRLVARQNELQREFQDKLLKFLTKEKGVKEEELPSAIGFTDLSPDLQREVQDLQKRMSVELEPLVLESTLTMQKILEAKDHSERVELLRFFVEAEKKRLEARKILQGMFTGDATGLDESFDVFGSNEDDEEDDEDDEEGGSATIFTDEPDAFQ